MDAMNELPDSPELKKLSRSARVGVGFIEGDDDERVLRRNQRQRDVALVDRADAGVQEAYLGLSVAQVAAQLRTLVRLEAKRLVPQELTRKLAPSVTRIAA